MTELRKDRIKLSVVTVAYNVPRELPRTLMSLPPNCQRHIDEGDYEVIVVDNGSDPPLEAIMVNDFGKNFRLVRIDSAPPSPAHAVNRGLAEACGDVICVMIDGARLASPGLVHFGLHGAVLYNRAVVATLGWYLGSDYQQFAIRAGYNQRAEDELLASINWPRWLPSLRDSHNGRIFRRGLVLSNRRVERPLYAAPALDSVEWYG